MFYLELGEMLSVVYGIKQNVHFTQTHTYEVVKYSQTKETDHVAVVSY